MTNQCFGTLTVVCAAHSGDFFGFPGGGMMYHTVAGIMFIQPGGQFLKIGVISLTVSAFVANILPIIEGYGNKNSGQKRISPLSD